MSERNMALYKETDIDVWLQNENVIPRTQFVAQFSVRKRADRETRLDSYG